MTATTELDYRSYWVRGVPFEDYLEAVEENERLWEGNWRTREPPAGALERASALEDRWRLLVLSEDWCGDASNTVPLLARLAEATPDLELRIVERDANPELMDRYTTDGSRSIPLVVVLDEDFEPRGRWGPDPRSSRSSCSPRSARATSRRGRSTGRRVAGTRATGASPRCASCWMC